MNQSLKMNNDFKLDNQVTELTLNYAHKHPLSDLKIATSQDAYKILSANWSDQMEIVEEFNILLLNRANKVLGMQNISKGGYSATVVDAKVVFVSALIGKASSIVLSHNHPSGNLRPSKQDEALTKRLVKGAKLLDLKILDHLIITSQGYYSFTDEGLMN